MKVFLGNAPWNKKGYYGVRAGSRWPHFEQEDLDYMPFPFFLAYATSVLETAGHDVLLVDGIAEKISENEFIDRITQFNPDLIFLEISTISIEVDLSLAKKLKARFETEKKIAVAGLHAFLKNDEFLAANPFIDFALFGEYEYSLLDLVDTIQKGDSLLGVHGLGFQNGDGDPVVNQRRPLIDNLDGLPWPARHYLPMESYHDEPGNIPRPSVQMQTSRGCPFRCIFCAWPQIVYGSHKYRTRNPIDVVDEFEWLVKSWGFKSVYFDDDTFNIGRRRILEICRLLKERDLNTPWAAMCRADTMTPEMLEAMKDSGLHAVKYGVEVADQRLLKHAGKALNIQKVKETVRRSHELGIKMHLTFMFGLPGETHDTAQRTIDLALELNPESVQFTIATPFPGSRYYHWLQDKGLITDHDFSKYDGFRSAVVRTEVLSSSDLEEIADKANQIWQNHVLSRKFFHMTQDGNKSFSVIIPNFNGKAFLQPCLDALVAQTKEDKEIILVDNGSQDDSVDFIRKNYPAVKVISLPVNAGFATAVNRGIEKARGDFIAVLNNDTVAETDWLETSCQFLVDHPEVGFCAPKIVKHDDPGIIDSVGNGLKRSGYSFNTGNGVRDSGQYDESREVFGASAAAAVYRKSMLDDIGLFDEDFFMYLEDVDLSFRAQLWGYKGVFLSGANVRHISAGTTGGQYHKDNVYYQARNAIYVLLKNMPRELIKTNIFRIFGFLFYLQLFHTFKTFHGWKCFKGICKGFRDFNKMIAKRKLVLGGRRISDECVLDKLMACEGEYNQFKRLR